MKKKFHNKWNRKGPPDCALGESKYHDRLRFLPVGSTRRARDHNPVISGLFSSSVVYSEVIFRSVKILGM